MLLVPVEVSAAPNGDKAVAVGEEGEDPDLVVVLEGCAGHGHDFFLVFYFLKFKFFFILDTQIFRSHS